MIHFDLAAKGGLYFADLWRTTKQPWLVENKAAIAV